MVNAMTTILSLTINKCNLIANLFPALPAIPPHIRLKLNKFNIRRELSSLLVSLHLVIIWLWSDQINPVSPLPSDFPTLRISFGQPDNPQSCCLQQWSILTPLFHTLYVFQKIRRDFDPGQYAMLNRWQYFWFCRLAVTAVLITMLLQPTNQTNN